MFRTMFRWTIAIGILLACSVTDFAQNGPAEVTDAFYSRLFHMEIRGLPNAEQLKEIAPYLSREIDRKIVANRKIQAAFIKKNPSEKPPWIEGDLFSSLFEGFSGFKVGATRKKKAHTEVDIKLSNSESSQYVEWTDTAILRKVGGRWVITNILYKGNWQFKSKSLLDELK